MPLGGFALGHLPLSGEVWPRVRTPVGAELEESRMYAYIGPPLCYRIGPMWASAPTDRLRDEFEIIFHIEI
jgi:hypothetical protein